MSKYEASLTSNWDRDESSRFRSASQIVPGGALPQMEACFHSYLSKRRIFGSTVLLLSIGPGEALLEKHLVSSGEIGSVFVVEPDSRLFSKLVGSKNEKIEGRCAKFQDFATDQRFDHVISLNSWYYIGTDTQALEKALSLLKPSGSLIIGVISETTFGNHIQSRFRKKEPYLTGQQIAAWLDTNHYKYDITLDGYSLPLSRFVSGETLTESGMKWSEFVVGRDLGSKDCAELVKTFRTLADMNGNLSYDWAFICLSKQT